MDGDKPLRTKTNRPQVRLSVRIASYVFLLVLLGTMLEISGRVAFYCWDDLSQLRCSLGLQGTLALDSYETPDSDDPTLWRLRSGFQQTLAQAVASKKTKGAVLGQRHLRLQAKALNVARDDVIYRVNSTGFKGPEIDSTKNRTRVLCLGDSCTFGSLFDQYCYARSMQREFATLGNPAEVINAGVEGYSPKHILKRIDEFKRLKPDIATVYIGWNAMYDERHIAPLVGGMKYQSGALWVASKVWERVSSLTSSTPEAALAAFQKKRFPDRNATELAAIQSYEFSFFPDVIAVIDELQSVGTCVVLITLPGLYTMDQEPNDEALRKGHLPDFTKNPFVLAKMTEVYNDQIRDLAVQRDLQVIDLAKWSDSALTPREKFFLDAVHLSEQGQQMIGRKIAHELNRTTLIKTVSHNTSD